jgi:hypothetical protein
MLQQRVSVVLHSFLSLFYDLGLDKSSLILMFGEDHLPLKSSNSMIYVINVAKGVHD